MCKSKSGQETVRQRNAPLPLLLRAVFMIVGSLLEVVSLRRA